MFYISILPLINMAITQINADKALYRIQIYRNCIKIHQSD